MSQTRRVFAVFYVPAFALSLFTAVPAPAQDIPDKIKKIALIPAAEPIEYVALTKSGGSAAAAFGLVGALIGGAVAAAQTSENTPKMTEAMRSVDAQLGAWLTDTLEARLRAQNLEIVRVATTRGKPYERLKDYMQIDTDADAILDIVITSVGYYRIQPSDDFGPGMRVELRLVSPKTQQVILSDDPAYGLANNWTNKHKYDPIYEFANMDRLRNHLTLAKQGLERGAAPVADEIAGKISDINRVGIAASIAAAKAKIGSDDPEAKRSDDRETN